MNRLIAIALFVSLAGAAANSAETETIEFRLVFSEIAQGAKIAYPFSDLPEGWTQGGLLGISGLAFPEIGGGPGYFTIPAGEFLTADPATIRFGWFNGGGDPVLSVTYYICTPATCASRPKGKFLIKTKSAVMGVRG
jgi:hypothetical protein